MNYLNDLNEQQLPAVQCTEGPVMVLAGAGSGKTRLLTYRIAYLIDKGTPPYNILALTFTNKAALEMKERVIKLLGEREVKKLWIGTFHAVFARILRKEANLLNYSPNYSIYATDDSKSLLRTIVKDKNLDDETYKPDGILTVISRAKSKLLSVDAFRNEVNNYPISKINWSVIADIYQSYNNRCFTADAMDFDDLLFNTYLLFKNFPEILTKYQYIFHYILVDEFQDTNYAQYEIIKQLARLRRNICVVGDDAQSIYAFRGANIGNILSFSNDYKENVKVFKLEKNYRSTKNIVNASNCVIQNNKQQLKKKIFTENDTGEKIKIVRVPSETEESLLIVSSIIETKNRENVNNNAFAVLYRTNAQSRVLEDACRKFNIPYRIYGGVSFYKRKEILDVLAYFRLSINQKDEEALKRIINFPPRSIGKTTIEKIILAGMEHNKNLWEILENISSFELDVSTQTISKIEKFVQMVKNFSSEIKTKNAYEMACCIATETGILKHLYENKTSEGINRYENVQELLNAIRDFTESKFIFGTEITSDLVGTGEISVNKTLEDFMHNISLLTNEEPSSDEKEKIDAVSLMTVHQAKGLEFPYIYIAGVEDGLFPSSLATGTREDLEEERRLFYVAMTRAQNRVMISYASTRYRRGFLDLTEPSRFISEIDKRYTEFLDVFYLSSDEQRMNTNKKIVYKIDNAFKTVNNLAPFPRPMEKVENGKWGKRK